MRLQTRLKLCSLTGLLALVVLGGLGLGVFLPDEITESVRRLESEKLERFATELPEKLQARSAADQANLTELAHNELLSFTQDDGQTDLSPRLNLAETVAKTKGLERLWLLTKDGLVLSAYPGKEQAGLTDTPRLHAAKQALNNHGTFFLSTQPGGQAELCLLRAQQTSKGVLLVSERVIPQAQTEQLAHAYGLRLLGFEPAGKEGGRPDDSDLTRTLRLENREGLALWHVRVQAEGLGAKALVDKLSKKMILVLFPLGLLFALILLLLGFLPVKEAERRA